MPDPHLSLTTRVSAALRRRPRLRLALLAGPPTLWIGVIYLGALGVLAVSAFWKLDTNTGKIVHEWTLENFRELWSDPANRRIVVHTVRIAATVAVVDTVLALPIAYYAARIASARQRALVLTLVVIPLWSSYLVRAYAWKTIFASGGVLDWMLRGSAHLSYSDTAVTITFCYLWLPFVILPVFASLERVPASLLEASGDLGARGGHTFRRVVLPLAVPGIAAGSIFSFSLTLGDYIAPSLVGGGKTQFIGDVIARNFGVAQNIPFGAAFTFVPVVVIALYLFAVSRTGAFEAL